MDIYLVEAIVNGVLLGGVLALLALGLNLIFGVIDVVWIAYADIVMCGMYLIYWLYVGLGWPLLVACAVTIVAVAAFGVLVHLLIIEPILKSAPINQLLATGGLLFFLQSFATLLFGTDFRNIGVRLPIIEIAGIYISYARLLAFAMALIGVVFMLLVYFPLRGRPPFLVILTTIAMGIVLENLALIIWGPLPVSLPSPVRGPPLRFAGVVISMHQVTIFCTLTAILLLQFLLLTKTRFGILMQATAQDLHTARLVGIPINRTIAVMSCLLSA